MAQAQFDANIFQATLLQVAETTQQAAAAAAAAKAAASTSTATAAAAASSTPRVSSGKPLVG